jgi:glucoamylase
VDTVKVIDALLKVDTPNGPAWHRYNDDGYGEHEDGSPFDGAGIGRPWPLITGERAHYELAAGRQAEAAKLRRALEGFMGDGRLIPEQVWDAAAVPERGLYPGRPSGSAMPLVWAHAEYVKLRRSLEDGAVFDAPPQTKERYVVRRSTRAPYSIWRFNHKCRSAAPGGTLRVELLAPAVVHWSADGWKTERDTATRDTGMGVFLADLPLAGLRSGAKVLFTFYWPLEGRWEGSDFGVDVGAGMERTAPSEPARPGTGRRRV